MTQEFTPGELASIRKALEDEKYEWRTVGGVVRDSGLPLERVNAYLRSRASEIVQSSIPSKDGEELFTTADHYARKASPIRRISNAFRNRKA